jgi:Carboxypeptidase regulatory-like domain
MRARRQTVSVFATLVLCVFMFALCSAPSVWAQSTNSGTIAGTVTDQTNAVVNGASVTLTDTSTRTSRSSATNDAGRYIFVDVAPGTYDLSVSKQGFSTSKTQVTVKVGVATNANLALQVGGGNVVVEVTAAGNELQTMNATVGNTITSLTIDNLPSLGRDVSTFVELQPGVSPDGSVAGAVMDQNYFSLDGGNNTNDMDGSMNIYTNSFAGDPTGGIAAQNSTQANAGPTGVMPTPQDSIEEFKVNTAGQTADFNSSAGAEVKVVTKRGTNAFHGTAYEYYKDNNWSANTWQNNFNGIPIPSFHYSRYGGAIGGPLIPKEVLGGKTYFFFNYEGFSFPNSETVTRNVPTDSLRLGLLQDSAGNFYNLNPTSVTFNGTTYPTGYGCSGPCDPRNLGINPLIQQLWSTYEPEPNAACAGQSLCDTANVLGYAANLSLPQKSKFAVARIDHDFSSKWHFMTSYRYYKLTNATDDQVDIGGFFSGDKLGTPVSQSSDPQQAWFWVAGLTTNISSNTTNDLHYSFLRNWWQWARAGDTVQLPGLVGGALEVMSGQSKTQDLGPFNVNTQQTRTRFWDGHDQMLRDDVSMLKGNHLFQFGGTYQHNFNWHQRTDNGGGINYQPVYELGNGTTGSGLSSDIPLCSTASISNCGSLTAAALGIVSIAQTAYTRSGATLTLNPPLTPAFDQSTIPYYNTYFSDTWHMKPTFTLTYGLGWTLEMPPVEAAGKQVELVDEADQPVGTQAYLAARQRAALLGQVYNPEVGFALVGNTGNGLKYPYNPFYGEFSPRIAAAWNPRFDSDSWAGKIFGHEDTVIRGGYGRVFGRLNGVDLVLVPLLGTGLIQPVQCRGNLAAGGGTCGPGGSATPTTAFRIGVDGVNAPIPQADPTLPQPDFPGYNAIAAGAGEALDPNFRPNQVDSFDFTIQRQLSRKVTLEFGYIGRRITHEYQPININAVPYMMTLGGQQFSQAYRNVVLQYCGGITGLAGGNCAANAAAVTPQPFFEAAMNPAYCAGFSSCTAAVVANEGGTPGNAGGNIGNAQVWTLWSDLDNGGFNFPRSMMNTPIPGSPNGSVGQLTSGVGINASIGYGNYNAGFASLKMADWKGVTMQSNFTWSKALGTGAVYQATSEYTADDPFNLSQMYGRQSFDRKFVYNMFVVYQPPFFKGQSGFMGRVLGGWTFSSIFVAGTGQPFELYTTTGGGQEFGGGDNSSFFGNENAIPIGSVQSGKAYPVPGSFPNIFKDGGNAINSYRNPILGLDTRDGGYGIVNGLRYWNMDFSIKKSIRVAESVSVELQGVFSNVLNHNQWEDPDFSIGLFSGAGGFGVIPGENSNTPRNIEVGLRVKF